MRILLILILTCFSYLFILNNFARAQVVINEVFPNPSGARTEPDEFIELINLSQETVSLSGYKIRDATSKVYVIEDINLVSGGFISFRREVTKIALNNSGTEEVVLLNNLDYELDRFLYEETTEDRTWSRIPDGSGSFFNGTVPSEGAANNPAPSPTPEPTSRPTSTPKPTKPPKPTSTAKPTTSLTSAIQLNEEVLGHDRDISSDIEVHEDEIINTSKEEYINEPVSDLTINKIDRTEEDSEEEEFLDEKKKSPLGAGFFILGGLGFIGAAGYPIIKKNGLLNVIKQEKD